MRRTLALVGGLALLCVVAPTTGLRAAPGDQGRIPGAYIVTLHDHVSPDRAAADHSRAHGAQVRHVYRHAINGYAAAMSDAAAARIAGDSRVRSVVADRVVHALGKPVKSQPAQTTPTGVRRIGGADEAPGAAVAVLDTGVDLTHPDLLVSARRKNCTTERDANDGNGHGTHVAGTIGAKSNDTGVVGVAPSTEIVPVKVLTRSGSGSWSTVICGVDFVKSTWSTPTPIRVANMSLGGTGELGTCTDGGLRQALCTATAAGTLFAVAAGNDGADAQASVPARYPEVVTVSAIADSDGTTGSTTWQATCRTDQEDTLADFSNYGDVVDVAAPGVCILSTWKGGGYNTISGTSMAAPHVAGVLAAAAAANSSWGPEELRAAIIKVPPATLDWSDESGDGTHEPLVNIGAQSVSLLTL